MLLMDYLISYGQLCSLLIDDFYDLKGFQEQSKIDLIANVEPNVSPEEAEEWFNLLEKKLIHLEIVRPR